MSKAAKQGILILIVLLAVSLGFAGLTLMEKQKIEQQKNALEAQLQESQGREKSGLAEVQKLKEYLTREGEEKSKFQKEIASTQERVDDLLAQISEITAEKDKWKRRLENIQKERDELLVKIQEKPKEKIVYKYVEKEPQPPKPEEAAAQKAETAVLPSPQPLPAFPVQPPVNPPVSQPAPVPQYAAPPVVVDDLSAQGAEEEHWAQLLKEKASLELDIGKLKDELSKRSIEIVELKQSNEALKIELDALKHAKEEIEDTIQQKEELANNLSLELARTKNDKKFVAEKAAKLGTENGQLRQQIKQLSSAKSALEKSIVRLTGEKDEIQKKLGETESIVQSKIDEIWEIKDSLDRSFKAARSSASTASGEVELPPIVVSAGTARPVLDPASGKPGFEGKVLSLNETNNFVIVDIGKKRGLREGDSLGVYRGSEYIARLEVIQVREDIAAADLKEQWAKVRVGDTVR